MTERSGRLSTPLTAFLVVATLVTLATATAGQAAAETPIFSIDEVERGQTGYGLSVFRGTEPERFGVEVIGVIRDNTAELSYILARLSGQNLEEQGVSAGMSGSPVYFDDRLAGAVSFSYSFSEGAIAGITPIEGMRKLDDAAQPPDALLASTDTSLGRSASASWAAPDLESVLTQHLDPATLDSALRRLAPRGEAGQANAGQTSTIAWHAAGFGTAALARLEPVIGPVTIGSSSPTRTALAGTTTSDLDATSPGTMSKGTTLRGGDAVAMVLVDGDLSLAAHGTVTEVEGDRILAFGHSVFSLGPTVVPMARSEVLTVIDSLQSSFKLSNAGAIIGAFDQDREAGARGVIGKQAPMIPVKIALRGAEHRDYSMRVADLPTLLPAIVSITTFGAINAGSYSLGEMGMDLEARLGIAGHDDLVLRQSFDSGNAAIESILYLLNVVGYVTGNALEAGRLTELDVTFHQTLAQRGETIITGYADRRQVAPGESVGVTLELQSFRGPVRRMNVEVDIPHDVPNGTYFLFLGDGVSIDGARDTAQPASADNLVEALALIGRQRNRMDLAILGFVGASGLTLAGDALPALPGSMHNLIAKSGQPTKNLQLVVASDETRALDRPIDGYARIDLEIKRPQP